MRVITLSLNFVVYALAVSGNACVLLAFVKYKALRKQDCIYLITFLALCDMCTGLTSLTFVSSNILLDLGFISNFTKWECLWLGYGQMVPLSVGQLMMMFIAFDRCQVFRDPLGYRHKDSFKYAVRSLLFSLCFSIVYLAFVFVDVDYDTHIPFCSLGFCWTLTFFYFFTGYLIVVGCAVFFLYILVMILMRRATFLKQNTTNLTTNRQKSQKQLEKSFRRQIRVTKTVNTVLFFYTIFWLIPMGVFLAAVFAEAPLWFLGVIEPIADVGVGLNSSVNVLVYAVKHKVIRAFLVALFKCKSGNAVHP